ncbi:cyclin-dependent kinase 11B isoform X2 [Ricinus communis]|uniref:cyclin-dependent kinase 11B isoform X2 n=1 Tax=Ricinus communis TaxID=3988 RepID=UPI00201A81BC|nr:cyclin-dependent kinase 11B isoform X2 [Ricinus communis]
MAAGGIDVSRRRSNNCYSNNHLDRYKNGTHHLVYNKNGHHYCSSSRSFSFKRDGISCRDEEKELGEIEAGYGLDRLEDGEIPVCEDGIKLHLERKRKFSPIIWDVEDNLSLKKKALSNFSKLSPPGACGHGLNNVTDAVVAKDTVPAGLEHTADKASGTGGSLGASGSESKSPVIASPSCQEKNGNDDQEKGQREEEEGFPEARNISMSRWASDSDSPRDASFSDDEGSPGETVYRKDSSTRILGGNRLTPTGSIGRDCSAGSSRGDEDFGNQSENGDLMDVDQTRDVIHDVNQMDDSCCQAEEPIAATQRSVDMLEGCRSVYEFERLHEINEGTYGKVYKALDKKTGKPVALKKVKMDVGRDRNLEEYGFPITSLREINILLSFHHPSIVNVREVVVGGLDSVFMVMEYMEHDLKGFMQVRKQPFSTSEVKCLMLQLLEGVKYLHDNWVLHRDLKTSNLLLNNEGDLKICDFGMSRQYGSPLKSYTSLVVTLWYRAPELLLGAKQYSTAIDMWSVGCIMAELLSKEPLFKGKSEIDQLAKIFGVLGTPSEKIWPGFSNLPGAKANFVKQPYNLLRKKFPATFFTGSPVLSDLGLDLLNKLLTYDPEKRLTAEDALNHAWFREVPLPTSKEFMPTLPPQYAKNRGN